MKIHRNFHIKKFRPLKNSILKHVIGSMFMVKKIFIIGATGLQGYPAAKELLKKGFEVKGLSRGENPKARELKELGAEMVQGDIFDIQNLSDIMEGCDGLLFIPIISTSSNPITEYTIGYNAILAAEKAGITHMIHTSVDRAGEHENFIGWGDTFGENYRFYWLAKSAVIDLVKASKIPNWTIFKPAYMMEGFIPPNVYGIYPLMKEGQIISSRFLKTELHLMNGEDQAKLIAEAFISFDKFNKKEIPLAGDGLTMEEIAQTISDVTGKEVVAVYKNRQDLLNDEKTNSAIEELFGSKGHSTELVLSATIDAYEWDNDDGYKADVEKSNSYGVKLRTFSEWCKDNKEKFDID